MPVTCMCSVDCDEKLCVSIGNYTVIWCAIYAHQAILHVHSCTLVHARKENFDYHELTVSVDQLCNILCNANMYCFMIRGYAYTVKVVEQDEAPRH